MNADINPQLLTWARERAGLRISDLSPRFAKLATWEEGAARPTLGQLERFAKAVRLPFGFLFLEQPPIERLPIPDFRTFDGALPPSGYLIAGENRRPKRPSPDLLETIYNAQEKQVWYSDYARANGLGKLDWIRGTNRKEQPAVAAGRMRDILDLHPEDQRQTASSDDFLRRLVDKIEDAGVLVLINGVVGQNSRRPLSVEEFRGFALIDDRAPLIFINGRDHKAAQLFTLAHEFAHLLLGTEGLSNWDVRQLEGTHATEVWCNRVASEFLVPRQALRQIAKAQAPASSLHEAVQAVRKAFKVSNLVALIALRDADLMSQENFDQHWEAAQSSWTDLKKNNQNKRGGGDYYQTSSSRNSKRLTRAVIADTLEGKTLYRDAFNLLGLKEASFKGQCSKYLGNLSAY